MSRQEEMVKERLKKIKVLKDQGINPYPYRFEKKDSAKSLQEQFKKLKPEEHSKYHTTVAGRLMNNRDMGKIAFGVLQDESGTLQLVFQEKETPQEVRDLFKQAIDAGDFIGIEGTVFRTKRGELSVLVKKIELLSKSILPLPDKWHGLEDKEERYRKRYLDLVMNPNVKEVFDKREIIIDTIRSVLKERGFHEVDTPYLQTVYGGASARPFKTHLNALDIPLFLAISPELYLKRLIVGGYEKVFTIARNFRNEGIDRWHNPEFTMMEIYQAYADYNDMMELFEDLYVAVCKKLHKSTKVKFKDTEIDFKKPWKRMTMAQAIKHYADIDVEKKTAEELFAIIEKERIEVKGSSWGWAVAALFEHYCESKLIQPTFIIDHPKETTPLCKVHRKDKDGRYIERFEPFCMGAELGNAYSELNDPQVQKQLLQEQQSSLSSGNEEANPYDEDFVNALAVGMPPTGGVGIGIDRMIMLITGQDSIRDVLLFPFMKPSFVSQTPEKKPQAKHSIKNSSLPLTREQALELVKQYNSDPANLAHYLESEAVMRELALTLGEDEEQWGMLGLLHDIDWELTKHNVVEHLTKAPDLLKKAGFDERFIQTIVSHGYGFDCAGLKDKKRTLKVEHALAASETITGLIHAYALMRKTISGMEPSGLMKKFKDKKFAAAVSRDIIKECEQLGITLEEFFRITILAIQKVSKEVGLP